ncbi:MAG TPA: hypothetical protein VKA09_06900 [Nitrososphaeraceae archaeon]|jgi:hypothetical protein|nr:hypothetical protein [Nitrososphaeraceae archaeon]
MVASSTPDFERSILRMGSIAFLAGMVIFLVSTILHPGREDPTNHPLVFAEYAEDELWVASHIGQFAGGMLAFAGGFIALFRLLSRSESGITSALAWMGLAATIAAGSALAVLQAVDGIALKIAVDTWYAIAPSPSADDGGEKAIAFRVAEGIRWTEIAANSFFRILQGSVGIIFGVAIAVSAKTLSRWIGALGVFAGVATIILGVRVAYVGFATVGSIEDTVSTWTYLAWVVILGIFMWRKTTAKKMTTTTR